MKLGALVLVVALWSCAGAAQASPPDVPEPSVVTDGAVRAIARADGRLYLGGDFRVAGQRTGPSALLDANGSAVAPWPEVTRAGGLATVDAAVADGAGGWYLAGEFSTVGGVARARLAHVRPDGSVDPAFAPAPDGRVRHLALASGRLVAAGDFGAIGSATRAGLAALDPATGAALAWTAGNGEVTALAAAGGVVYVASTPGSGTDGALSARAGATGAALWTVPIDDAPETAVRVVAPAGDAVYFGGGFRSAGGAVRYHVAAVDAADGDLRDWDPDVVGEEVAAIAVRGSTVHLGGTFTAIGGDDRRNLAAVDAVTGIPTGWAPDPDRPVTALALSGDRLQVAGRFTLMAGEDREGLAAFAADGTLAAWAPAIVAVEARFGNTEPPGVRRLYPAGAGALAVGRFAAAGAARRSGLAAFDEATGRPLAWAPEPDGSVRALAVHDGVVYAGGTFTEVSTAPRWGLAAIDAASGAVRAWDAGLFGSVDVLVVSPPSLLIGGRLVSVGGAARVGAAAVGLADGALGAWAPGAAATVTAIVPAGDRVWLAGRVQDTPDTTGVVAVDRVTGAQLAPSVTVSGPPSDDPDEPPAPGMLVAAVADGAQERLYVGGAFERIRGAARMNLAALDARTGALQPWAPAGLPAISALAVTGSSVVAASSEIPFSGVPRVLSEIRADGSLTGWAPNPDWSVGVLRAGGGHLDVGGGFRTIGGIEQPGFASFALDGGGPGVVRLSGGADAGEVAACAAERPGPVHQWRRDGLPIEGAMTAFRQIADADRGHVLTCTVTGAGGASTSEGIAVGRPGPPFGPLRAPLGRATW